jgi:hypothetical protein
MNPLKRGLEAVKAVKRNKSLFIILILLQIAFIVSVSFIGIEYQLKIYENAREIIEPLQAVDYNATAIEEGQPFMDDMMKEMISMTRNYQEMVKNIFKMILLLLTCFLIFNGLSWSLVNYLLKRNNIIKYWGKFVLVSLVFLVPSSLISYFILKNLLSAEAGLSNAGIKIVGWIFLIVSYFLLVGFCLVEEKLKDLFKKIFLVGVKKAHWVLLALLCYLSCILLSLVLIYFSINTILLTILGLLLLIIVLVLGKLFLAGVVKGMK